ncbi:MAG: NAD(P)/FAD-dependent oxidoreductase, partial [bacterium]
MKFPNSDCIIIGAGAAGLFCAGIISKAGKSVNVIEHNSKPGKKIRISGGGRCNFTNRIVKAQHFISQNPHFAVSALARYTPEDFIALVESHDIAYHEKTLGQLFCDESSQQIIDMLLNECIFEHTDIHYDTSVEHITNNGIFTVHTCKGVFQSKSLVIATGGLSIPSLGATPFGYDVAKQFGHEIIETRPALVPLHIDRDIFPCSDIAGTSLPVEVHTSTSPSFKESLLFTHKGLSGPAILQISSYLQKDSTPFTINLLPTFDFSAIQD